MSLVTQGQFRVYTRRFDHEECRARYEAGETVAALARAYGVSQAAVKRVVDPVFNARMRATIRSFYLAVCDECRGPCLSNEHWSKKAHGANDGRQLCMDCRSKARREAVEVDGRIVVSVRCVTCQQWYDPDDFPRGTRYPDLRDGGFHNCCRSCQTKLRQDYRDRHKVPCVKCGALRLPASEKRRPGVRDTGLCVTCYRARKKAAA